MRPSVLISSLSAMIAVIAIIMAFSSSLDMNTLQAIQIMLLASIALGVHGLQHSVDEIYYDFNPLYPHKIKNVFRDEPIR